MRQLIIAKLLVVELIIRKTTIGELIVAELTAAELPNSLVPPTIAGLITVTPKVSMLTISLATVGVAMSLVWVGEWHRRIIAWQATECTRPLPRQNWSVVASGRGWMVRSTGGGSARDGAHMDPYGKDATMP